MDTLLDFKPIESSGSTSARVEIGARSLDQRRSFVVLRWFVGLWFAIVFGGMLALAYHASIPGQGAQPPPQLAANAPAMGSVGKARLLLFLHPKCPCSRATLGELAKIVSRREKQLDTRVFFYRPAGFSPDWEKTDLWQMAEGIPGVRTMADVDGGMARRFEAKTSGQALLYDGVGQLVFSGGITAARGHSGDNPGESAIVSWLATGQIPPKDTPVFGCSLVQDSYVP
jgi:hypothetical protein